MLYDAWDAKGVLWHVGHALPFIAPELPGVVSQPYIIYDLNKGGYVASSLFNEGNRHFQATPRKPDSFFSPNALVAEAVR